MLKEVDTFQTACSFSDMHTISKILYHESSIRVIFESAEAFDLPIDSAFSSHIRSGSVLNDDEFEELKTSSSNFNCLQHAIKYAGKALRTEKMIRDYLSKKDFILESIEKAIDWLKEYKYLDDAKYAEVFLLSLLNRKIVGRLYAKNRLMQKGVSPQLAAEALANASERFEDNERIYEFALKKYNTLSNKKNLYAKLANSLKNRGIESRMIFQTLGRLQEEGYELNKE